MCVDEHKGEGSKGVPSYLRRPYYGHMSALFFATAGKSAVGLVRAGNEDSALTSRSIVAVADGMGGHAAGEVASRIAITTLAKDSQVFTGKDVDIDSADDLFATSLVNIDNTISEY